MAEKMKIYENTNPLRLYPLLATRGMVVLPQTQLSFDVGRMNSVKSVESAMHGGRFIVLSSQKDISQEEASQDNIFEIGTLAKIKQVVKVGDDSIRVVVKGIARVHIAQVLVERDHFSAYIRRIDDRPGIVCNVEQEATVRMLRDLFEEYCEYVPHPEESVTGAVLIENDVGNLSDIITGNTFMNYDVKQRILEELDPYSRASRVIDSLNSEIEVLKMERDIALRVKDQIDSNQREYYLKEQLKAIRSELGEDEVYDESLGDYSDKIENLSASEEVKDKLYKELEKLSKMPPMSHEGSVIEAYLDTVLEMPFGIKTELNTDLALAAKILDEDHYGMEKVKKLVLEHLAVRALNGDKGQILCLVGPPGVGKTSVAKSIARAMGRKYVRISLGGIRDEAEIRGHRRTYIGSMPGRIASAVRKAGCSDPLLLLDEIDKLCSDFHGDPASALLEVLDSEQNVNFEDHYLDVPFDLSGVFFVATANTLDTIPRPLLDRMDIVEMSSYLDTEKIHIAEKYLIPKQRAGAGLSASQIRFDKTAVPALISGYTREAGVRELERKIADIMRASAKLIVSGESKSVRVSAKNLESFLGTRKFRDEELYDDGMTGIVNGLAWTSVGGELLNVEVTVLEGTGKIDCTGSLGDVMKESVRAAVSYIRSVASLYDIDKDFYKNRDIHVHFPEGAVPKDGPSAGIAIATALVSALSLNPVRNTVAMTGEITLSGRVLPIGGLKEKTMAAYKNGVKTVIIPYGNIPDLKEIDRTVYDALHFVPVKTVDEVFREAVSPAVRIPGSRTEIDLSESGQTAERAPAAVLN